jgi:hypothetical protein
MQKGTLFIEAHFINVEYSMAVINYLSSHTGVGEIAVSFEFSASRLQLSFMNNHTKQSAITTLLRP